MDEKIRSTMTKRLGDLRLLEGDGAQVISHQIDEIRGRNQPEALRAIEDFKQSLDAHVNTLDARLNAFGSGPTPRIGQAVSAAAAGLVNLLGSLRGDPPSKMLSDDYVFPRPGALSSLAARTTARSPRCVH